MTKFPKALAAAGLAAVLVGCGGGSSETSLGTDMPMGPTQAEIMAAQGAYETGKNGIMDATTKADAKAAYDMALLNEHLTDMQKSSLMDALSERNRYLERMAITTALAALDTAVGMVDDQATDEQVTAADDARIAAMNAIADAEHLPAPEMTSYRDRLTSLAGRLTIAKASRTTAMAEAMRVGNNARIMPLAEAIMVYQRTNDTISDQLPDVLEQGSLDSEYSDGKITIELDDSNGNELMPLPAEAPGDWIANRFKVSDQSQGVVVTNHGGPTRRTEQKSYAQYFGYDPNDLSIAPTQAIPSLTVSSITASTGVLTFNADPAANARMLQVSDFGSGFVPSTKPARGEDPVTKNLPTGPTTFLGVKGSFSCGVTDCKVARDDHDRIYFTGTTITFTPDIPTGDDLTDITVRRMVTTPDNDYLYFGYWMASTGSGSSLRYTIDTFAEAEGYSGTLLADPSTLRGSATYSDGAAGIYVLKTGHLVNKPYLHDGEFTANVSLRAQFADFNGTVSDEDAWKITGTVNGFMSATNSQHNSLGLSDWSLGLEADIGTRDPQINAVTAPTAWPGVNRGDNPSGVTGTTKGTGADGTWSASFYGNTGAGTTAAADPATSEELNKVWTALGGSGTAPTTGFTDVTADDHPAAVVGEFTGHFINGHVVGAFGAEKD